MKVLLIEDEQHKANDLTSKILKNGVAPDGLKTVRGVRQAVLEVSSSHYDLIVLDMALPTFADGGIDGSGGGTAQALGGIEILRALSLMGGATKVIIVTQYPEIILGGSRVKLNQAGKLISKKYGQDVLGAVLYSYNTPEWENAFDALMRKAK